MADQIVVGIDFGNAYSGASWGMNTGRSPSKDIRLVNDWPGPITTGSVTDKVPSKIAYKDGRPHSWGYTVQPGEESFSSIKSLLDEDTALQYAGSTGESALLLKRLNKSTEEVVADYLRLLWRHVREDINRRLSTDVAAVCSFVVVLTVPAIWPDVAKQRLLKASRLAELSDTIQLIAEPEAAALAAFREMKYDAELPRVGDCFILCDAGERTVDLISYKVCGLDPFQMEECVVGNGGPFGSVFLDMAFEKYIRTIVGEEQFSRIKERAKKRMLRDFETGIKRCYSGDDQTYYVGLRGVEDNPAMGIDDDEIELKPSVIRTIFDHVINQILSLIEQQRKEIFARGLKTKAIMLVGGFGSNRYLYRRIKETQEHTHVLQPPGSWTLACRGATMWGLQNAPSSVSADRTVRARLSRYSYGLCYAVPFDPIRHSQQDRCIYPDGTDMAMNQMEWLIRKGDRLQDDVVFKRELVSNFQVNRLSTGTRSFSQELYYSTDDQPPTRKGPSVQQLCTVNYAIDCSKLRHEKSFRNPSTKEKWRKAVFELTIIPNSATISFGVSYKNEPVARTQASYTARPSVIESATLESPEKNRKSSLEDSPDFGERKKPHSKDSPSQSSARLPTPPLPYDEYTAQTAPPPVRPDEDDEVSESNLSGESKILNDQGSVETVPTSHELEMNHEAVIITHPLHTVGESKAGSEGIPADSGYASQSRAEDSHIGNDDIEPQSPSVELADETKDDDIESVVSDDAEIRSQMSIETTLAAQEGKLHLAQMLAADAYLGPLCRQALCRMDQGRFINTTRKLLKPYYRNLLREANSERERASVQLLKSRRGRQRIGTAIARLLDADGDDEEPEIRADSLEQVRRRAEYLDTWIAQVPNITIPSDFTPKEIQLPDFDDLVDLDGHVSDDDDDGDSATTDSDVPVLPHLSQMETFFRESRPFQMLLNEYRKLLLPRQLRQILNTIPKAQISLSRQQDHSFVNQVKSLVEDYTQLEWNWWPLEPRKRQLGDDQTRLFWNCVCASRLWLEISNQEAELIESILVNMDANPPWPHRCWPRRDWRKWASHLSGIIRTAAPTSSAGQRYTPLSNTASSSSSSTPSSGSSSNNTNQSSNASGQNASHQSGQQQGGSTSTQQPTATQTAQPPSNQLWVLFGVQGPRRPLEMEHILVDPATNDDIFYRTLRRKYRLHRRTLRVWFSFWRFQYCDVVKFKRLAPKWVIRDRKDLPSDIEYIYTPRPPHATNPPISQHEFEMHLYACDHPCRWSWCTLFHECMPQLNTSSSISCIPKKNAKFKIDTTSSPSATPSTTQGADAYAWGLEARHTISAAYVAFYHVLIFAGPFGFWAWWMTGHPGDLQNASVPITVVLGLLSLFWSTNGILTQGREAKRL